MTDKIQESLTEDIVQRQVDAYNARDIEAFCALYHDDIELYDFPNTLLFSGKAALAKRYSGRFDSNPDLNAAIHKRLVMGQFICDLETASGATFGSKRAIVIYEVEDNLIRRAWIKHDHA